MAKYIDAEVFKRKLIDEKSFFPALVARALEEMPAADVVSTKAFEQVKWERDTAIEQLESYGVGFCENKELAEVKHGRWYMSFSGRIKCSLCHFDAGRYDFPDYKQVETPYCPHCWAKMDGGKNK